MVTEWPRSRGAARCGGPALPSRAVSHRTAVRPHTDTALAAGSSTGSSQHTG
jgi:hypothetical protein